MRLVFSLASLIPFLLMTILKLASCTESFYAILDHEGIGANLVRIQAFWERIVTKEKRSLILLDLVSGHYNALRINLCEYFKFPKGITCSLNETSRTLVAKMKCYGLRDACNQWNCRHGYPYGLSESKNSSLASVQNVVLLESKSSIQLKSIQCGILNLFEPLRVVNTFRLSFQLKSVHLYQNLVKLLNLNIADLIAFHWRRFDFKPKCERKVLFGMGMQSAPNCLPASKLVDLLRSFGDPRNVYIATNENDMSELQTLISAGYKGTFTVPQSLNFSAFELVVVEMQLMTHAKTFITGERSLRFDVFKTFRYAPKSKLDEVVEIIRMQSNKNGS